jgi:hypothetical protein
MAAIVILSLRSLHVNAADTDTWIIGIIGHVTL